MTRFLFVLLSLLILIICIELLILVKLPTNLTKNDNKEISISKKVEQKNHGRTTFYLCSRENEPTFCNTGFDKRLNGFPYIVGRFEKWVGSEENQNRIMKLTDPKNNTNLPDIQVIFSSEKTQIATSSVTILSVEDLRRKGESAGKNKSIGSYDQKTLDVLIQKDDILVIVPLKINDVENQIKTDIKGNMIAHIILLRREKGWEDIQL